jgi:hypothetical protein
MVTPRSQLLHPGSIDIEADHIAYFPELDGQGQTDISQTHDGDGLHQKIS